MLWIESVNEISGEEIGMGGMLSHPVHKIVFKLK
jgi:hypothetical protein